MAMTNHGVSFKYTRILFFVFFFNWFIDQLLKLRFLHDFTHCELKHKLYQRQIKFLVTQKRQNKSRISPKSFVCGFLTISHSPILLIRYFHLSDSILTILHKLFFDDPQIYKR